MTSPKKSLLIFDLDGTLIDSVPDLAESINAMLLDFGYQSFSEDTIRHWVGNGATKLVKRALSASQPNQSICTQQTEQALAIFFQHYSVNTCVRTQPYAGVSEGLYRLKNADFTLALTTNKPYKFVPTILQTLGWQNYFSEVLGGDSLPEKKPHPAPLLYTCEKLKFSPKQSVMIGDSKNDILAGKHAGMDTIGLSYGYNYGEDIRLQHPTQTFDSFSDLVAYLLA